MSAQNSISGSQEAVDKLPSSPILSSQPSQNQSLAELVGHSFPSFDHQSLVVGPFTDEGLRDVDYEKTLSDMILDLILEVHAWGTSRGKHETNIAMQTFEKRIGDVIDQEKEQGMFRFLFEESRQRLNEFVTRMMKALEALTGFGF
ncbi:hypothetical protein C8J56DRAFT_240345 [Mycena floridula]|nr:hypothetical protein C8J56DRAFT_240345 [Mycena floridula]